MNKPRVVMVGKRMTKEDIKRMQKTFMPMPRTKLFQHGDLIKATDKLIKNLKRVDPERLLPKCPPPF